MEDLHSLGWQQEQLHARYDDMQGTRHFRFEKGWSRRRWKAHGWSEIIQIVTLRQIVFNFNSNNDGNGLELGKKTSSKATMCNHFRHVDNNITIAYNRQLH